MKVVGRVRTPEGQVVRVGLTPAPESVEPVRRPTPPPDFLFQPLAREREVEHGGPKGRWWFLRLLSSESYGRHF